MKKLKEGDTVIFIGLYNCDDDSLTTDTDTVNSEAGSSYSELFRNKTELVITKIEDLGEDPHAENVIATELGGGDIRHFFEQELKLSKVTSWRERLGK